MAAAAAAMVAGLANGQQATGTPSRHAEAVPRVMGQPVMCSTVIPMAGGKPRTACAREAGSWQQKPAGARWRTADGRRAAMCPRRSLVCMPGGPPCPVN